MTDTEATEPKAEKTAEQKAHQHVTRAIARGIMKLEGKASAEETKKRWEKGKTKYLSSARSILKTAARDGVTFQVDEASTNKAKRAAKKTTGAEATGSTEA